MASSSPKPIVLITGAAGNIGRSLASALADSYTIIGFDKPGEKADFPLFGIDLTKEESIAAAFAAFRKEHGRTPYVLLHRPGLYGRKTSVPTLANPLARIYEGDLQSHIYSGSTTVGQAMLHRNDMLDAFRRTVDRRKIISSGTVILIGEQ